MNSFELSTPDSYPADLAAADRVIVAQRGNFVQLRVYYDNQFLHELKMVFSGDRRRVWLNELMEYLPKELPASVFDCRNWSEKYQGDEGLFIYHQPEYN